MDKMNGWTIATMLSSPFPIKTRAAGYSNCIAQLIIHFIIKASQARDLQRERLNYEQEVKGKIERPKEPKPLESRVLEAFCFFLAMEKRVK